MPTVWLVTGEQVIASLAQETPPATSAKAAPASQEVTYHVRVINPAGGLVTPALNHPPIGISGMRADYGTVMLSTAIDHTSSGSKRFRVPGGWLNERSREDGEMVCEVLGSLESLENLLTAKRDILLGRQEVFCTPLLKSIVPVLVGLHQSVMAPHLKTLSRSIIHKTLYHIPSDILQSLMADDANWVAVLSTFISSLASSRQELALVAGLQIATVLVEKVPQAMRQALIREGIVSAAQAYLASDNTPEMTSPSFSCSPLASPGSNFLKSRAKELPAGEIASMESLTRPVIASLCESLVGRVRRGSIDMTADDETEVSHQVFHSCDREVDC